MPRYENSSPLVYLGNKSALVSAIVQAMPIANPTKLRWIVPFCGSLAAPLALKPERAVFSDVVPELMHLWRQIAKQPSKLLAATQKIGNTEAAYYVARERLNTLITAGTWTLERAAIWLMINRLGYRGRYRVNSDGQCNIPFGHRGDSGSLPSAEALQAVSSYLSAPGISLVTEGWQNTLFRAVPGDLAMLDPPYHQMYDYQDMTGADAWGEAEQIEIRDWALKLIDNGVHVMLHNNATPFILDAYSDPRFQVVPIGRQHKVGYGRTLNADTKELIITAVGKIPKKRKPVPVLPVRRLVDV